MTRQSITLTRRPTPTSSPLSSRLLHRKCSCGQHTIAGGKCEECQKGRFRRETNPLRESPLQRRSVSQAEPSEVPPIVYEMLRSPRKTLALNNRTFLEPRLGHDFSQVKTHSDLDRNFQANLAIGQAGDKFEQEADWVAQQVIKVQQPSEDTPVQAEAPIKQAILLRKKQTPLVALPVIQKVLCSSGQQLDLDTRAFMESYFGQDFSHVRIHKDTRAAKSAKDLDALAYTSGRDIVFNSGRYQPNTFAGKTLLAHELTHVVQQMNLSPQQLIQRQTSGSGDSPPSQNVTGAANTQAKVSQLEKEYRRLNCRHIRILQRLNAKRLSPQERVRGLEQRLKVIPRLVEGLKAARDTQRVEEYYQTQVWGDFPKFPRGYILFSESSELLRARCELNRARLELLTGRSTSRRLLRQNP